MSEEESDEINVKGSKKWLWAVLIIAVIAVAAFVLLRNPAPAHTAVDNLPTMVGGC